ncbi:GMC family oxidoreductase [Deinococcus sp. AJ005]|uniref:GMC family oxidoreductase n=1 Tax=Deinococcus sp. AJ005 TaxID=2652443 RepID=UPI00125CCDE5|nr:GMC family oxidoreductase N-terminal domain-containing protein [Deinococcus sp. AJ005]QFP77406.1 choline dehydrogenase [Deinococcus sp. AJ005]
MQSDHSPDGQASSAQQNYDYVVIGAGSGGCAVSARLQEGGAQVLLLEAGVPDETPEIHIPAAFPKLFKSPLDWNYETEAQEHLNGRKLYWPRGKMLGGSSSINAMIYIRGHRADYDGWAAAGNHGWGYDDVLPYFLRSEDFEDGASEYHNAGGPLHVENRRYTHEICDAITEGFKELGHPANDDFNGESMEGVGRFHVTQKGGARHSAAVAYLRPALASEGPGKLEARTGAHVTRILFEGKKAVGVEYLDGTEPQQVMAGKGVILAAGAITSPHLLMLSGVGERAQLEAAGVEVLHDLPGVGQNLQDHLFVPVVYDTETAGLKDATSDAQMTLYMSEQRGMLCSNVGETGGFMKTDASLPAPDLQFHNGAALFVDHGFAELDGYHYTLLPSLVAPRSRGRIRIASSDPQARPLIEPEYLSDPHDMDVLIAGVELARQVGDTEALSSYRLSEVMPGEAVTERADLENYIREQAMTVYHPVGTCKMGNDELAVVDDELRVRGLENLWIADASVMPVITRGNTNAPTIMIAEKAADLILGRAALPARAAETMAMAVSAD